jgi:hypothetical protein
MRRSSVVKVMRPHPETGELIEEVVAPRHFKPRPPRRPRIKEPARTSGPGAVGLRWLAVYDLRVKEWLYWEGYRHRLTRQEREAIAAGATSVIRPIEQEWETGEVLEVALNLSAEVIETTWMKRRVGGPFENDLQYRTSFRVTDGRPFLLRRGVIGSGTPAVDAIGDPVAATGEEIDQARIDSGYTESPSRAIDDSGEEVDPSLHRSLHRHQPAANARRQARLTRKQKIERIEERIEDAKKRFERKKVGMLERQLRSLKKPHKKAA